MLCFWSEGRRYALCSSCSKFPSSGKWLYYKKSLVISISNLMGKGYHACCHVTAKNCALFSVAWIPIEIFMVDLWGVWISQQYWKAILLLWDLMNYPPEVQHPLQSTSLNHKRALKNNARWSSCSKYHYQQRSCHCSNWRVWNNFHCLIKG